MNRISALLSLILLTLVVPSALAGQARVQGLRVWVAPDHTRLVFDTSGPVEHKIFPLHDPDRLVIDIEDTRLDSALPPPGENARFLKRLRSAPRNGDDLRVVLDLQAAVRTKSFMLPPNKLYGHRLVVDLLPREGSTPKKVVSAPSRSDRSQPGRDVIIAVDAGHGGDDPGARGPTGVYEKDVVLAVARRLAQQIDAQKGMRAVMIRTGDYYIGLRKRMRKARDARADLFVSIHADAFSDPRVRGSSVYTLSQRGASSEAARWLAESENNADLVGGIELDDKDDLLASVLLDLSQSATMEASRQAADQVLKSLKHLGKAHKLRVQHAGFVVLKSPDIPSMLVETAFISNPTEESNLSDPGHQERLAEALMGGLREYFTTYPPAGTLLAQRAPKRHVIARGDTLSEIADQYSVSLRELRMANNLHGDRIRVGQVLRIPGSDG